MTSFGMIGFILRIDNFMEEKINGFERVIIDEKIFNMMDKRYVNG